MIPIGGNKMNNEQFAKEWINAIWNNDEKTMYHSITKDTLFFAIESKQEVSLQEVLTVIRDFKETSMEIMSSSVCVKILLKKENQELHLFFQIARNRLRRVEFCYHC